MGIWEPGDDSLVPRLLEAKARVHPEDISESSWFLWKFRDSPWGSAVVAYAYHERTDRIAGLVAFGMWRLAYRGKPLRAALSYGTLVDADFRRRGLFTRMASAAQEELGRRGVSLIFNFPNQNSRPGFLKLGWEDLGGPATWFKPVKTVRVGLEVLRRRFTLESTTPDRIGSFESTGEEWLQQWASSIAERSSWDTPYVGVRDLDMLAWRYRTYPLFRYLFVERDGLGAIVRTGSRMGLREAQIMDVFHCGIPRPRAFRRLMRAVAREAKADLLTILLTRGHPLHRLLPSSGFLPIPNNGNFFGLSLDGRTGDLGQQRNWAISGSEIHTW